MQRNGFARAIIALSLRILAVGCRYGWLTARAPDNTMQVSDWCFIVSIAGLLSFTVGYHTALVINPERLADHQQGRQLIVPRDDRIAQDLNLAAAMVDNHQSIDVIQKQVQWVVGMAMIDQLIIAQLFAIMTAEQRAQARQVIAMIHADHAHLADAAFRAKWYPPDPSRDQH